MGHRVRKVGVKGVESRCGVGGVKGRKSWDRGVGSEGLRSRELELGDCGGGVRRVGVEGVGVGGVGVEGVGVSEVGVRGIGVEEVEVGEVASRGLGSGELK